jgi:hypothetical protein
LENKIAVVTGAGSGIGRESRFFSRKKGLMWQWLISALMLEKRLCRSSKLRAKKQFSHRPMFPRLRMLRK